MAALTGVWKIVHASRAFLHKMMPREVVCFATHFAEMHRDFAISVLAAKTKEPIFIKSLLESWRASPANYTGADLTCWIQRGVEACAEAGNMQEATELAQLLKKGSGRNHLGPQALGDASGIIRKKPAGSLRLEFAEETDLEAFVSVCRKFQNALGERGTLSAMLDKVAGALSEAGEACAALHVADPASAVRGAVLRKFVCGYLADGGAVDWEK